MKLSYKIFAFSFLISVAVLTTVAVHTVEKTTEMLVTRTITDAASHARREATIMRDQIEATKSDVLLLANINASRLLPDVLLEMEKQEHRAELERIFFTVMKEKRFYSQVRLISVANDGMELVRMDQDANGIFAVSKEDLQAKADRYYFQKTVSLVHGQVFASRLDLNQEHGVIVKPYQPTFRISTPVFNNRGKLVAIVIINVDVSVLQKEIVPLGPGGFSILTDRNGEYLFHPDSSRTFAFEFGGSDRVQDEFDIQEEWAKWIDDPDRVTMTASRQGNNLAVAKILLPGTAETPERARTLVVGNVLPRTLIEKAGDALRTHLYITLLIVCVFLGIVIAGAIAYLTRPVTALTRFADRITAGETNIDVPATTTEDEVGALAKAFKRMLLALEEAGKTKELAAVGRMASMVAHDLRNALSSIKVTLHSLEKECSISSPQQEKQWGLANEQIRYMENVYSDMLSFARPEKYTYDWQDPRTIVDAAAIAVLPKAAEKNVEVQFGTLPPLPAVWGDRTQLIRVFRNLVENAVQAVGEGGVVRFEGKVAASDMGNDVILKVIDNGEGIPPESRDHLFEPFFTTRAAGTGLGLAIVKLVLERHGGSIDFETKMGEGTTFVVALHTQSEPDD